MVDATEPSGPRLRTLTLSSAELVTASRVPSADSASPVGWWPTAATWTSCWVATSTTETVPAPPARPGLVSSAQFET